MNYRSVKRYIGWRLVEGFGAAEVVVGLHSETGRESCLEDLVEGDEVEVDECAEEEVEEEVVAHVEVGLQVAHVVEGADEVELYHLDDLHNHEED